MKSSLYLLLTILSIASSEFVDLSPSQPNYARNIGYFRLSINDITSITSISFELTCYSGNCLIPAISPDETMTERLEVTTKSNNRKISLSPEKILNKYAFIVKCTACYYQIIAIVNKQTNFILEKEYSNQVMIALEDTSNTYTIKKEENATVKKIFIVNAINCIPSITVEETTYETGKYFHHVIDDI